MHKTRTGNKNNVKCHLWLVSSRAEPALAEQPVTSVERPVDPKQINYLAVAMMNRLWIPPTTTIVGLLDVGSSQDNFQELSKWIEKQLASSAEGGAANELPQLERQFRDAVSHYPEF